MIITCPDCHKPVSDQAPVCPHCGHPFSLTESDRTKLHKEQVELRKTCRQLTKGFGFMFLLGLLFLWAGIEARTTITPGMILILIGGPGWLFFKLWYWQNQ